MIEVKKEIIDPSFEPQDSELNYNEEYNDEYVDQNGEYVDQSGEYLDQKGLVHKPCSIWVKYKMIVPDDYQYS